MPGALSTTSEGGFRLAAQAFELSIERIAIAQDHPQVRVGHALLWGNVINDAFHRVGGTDYESMRDHHSEGRVIPGLILAFNALKHGAALCAEVRPDVSGPGWAAGPWVLTSNLDDLIRTFDRAPSPAQVSSYRSTVAGRPIEKPFREGLGWFEHAINRWSV